MNKNVNDYEYLLNCKKKKAEHKQQRSSKVYLKLLNKSDPQDSYKTLDAFDKKIRKILNELENHNQTLYNATKTFIATIIFEKLPERAQKEFKSKINSEPPSLEEIMETFPTVIESYRLKESQTT